MQGYGQDYCGNTGVGTGEVMMNQMMAMGGAHGSGNYNYFLF
jgi:hypothetical protein